MASHDAGMLGAEHDIVTVLATPSAAGDLAGEMSAAATVVTAELVVCFAAVVPTAFPAQIALRLVVAMVVVQQQQLLLPVPLLGTAPG